MSMRLMPFTQKWLPLRGGKRSKCERTAKEEAPVALASGCMASQGDGPDLGRQKIKEIAFFGPQKPKFFLASRRRSEGTLKRRFSLWALFCNAFLDIDSVAVVRWPNQQPPGLVSDARHGGGAF